MKRHLILIFLFPFLSFAQTKSELTKYYSQAIADYIKVSKKEQHVNFDTLFFGKHDQLPDIKWPQIIEGTPIRFITNDAKVKNKEHFVNMVGTVTKDNAEFIFFTFSKNSKHEFDYFINYKFNAKKKVFELEKISFKGPPFK